MRKTRRKKDGKTHSYWSVVESQGFDGCRVVQRYVLYLGKINSSQAAGWRKAIGVPGEDLGCSWTLALSLSGAPRPTSGSWFQRKVARTLPSNGMRTVSPAVTHLPSALDWLIDAMHA